MTTFQAFRPSFANASNLTPLQRAIAKGSYNGTIRYGIYGPPEITAPLESIADTVESAYVLTPKDELPKVTASPVGSFEVEGIGALWVPDSRTAEGARKRAAAWLAIAKHLEAEEKAKAYEEAKAKAVADKVAEAARQQRLNELADEWFGKDFYTYLSPNKASAVKEIYRLETKLTEDKDAA